MLDTREDNWQYGSTSISSDLGWDRVHFDAFISSLQLCGCEFQMFLDLGRISRTPDLRLLSNISSEGKPRDLNYCAYSQ